MMLLIVVLLAIVAALGVAILSELHGIRTQEPTLGELLRRRRIARGLKARRKL